MAAQDWCPRCQYGCHCPSPPPLHRPGTLGSRGSFASGAAAGHIGEDDAEGGEEGGGGVAGAAVFIAGGQRGEESKISP